MSNNQIYSGNTLLNNDQKKVGGRYVELDGEKFYEIENYDEMPPFFMSVVGHLDSWMFISSTGGLSAGRKNEDNALFPYYTEDKISEAFETTGSKTLILAKSGANQYLWEPFSNRQLGTYSVNRNIYKNITGNVVLFEEINDDLKLVFRYSWSFSEKYGFVKKSTIESLNESDLEIRILDGIQNLLPHGVNSALQRERSNLVNAYKRNELVSNSSIGLFTLSSMIVDRAIPSESLKANVVWSTGIDPVNYLLSSRQLSDFRRGKKLNTESDVKAEPGAYFIEASEWLSSGQAKTWWIMAQLGQDHAEIAALQEQIKIGVPALIENIKENLTHSTNELKRLVGMSDGLQLTGDELGVSRHYANVMFNVMRGGLFVNQYLIDVEDFKSFVFSMNRKVADVEKGFFSSLEGQLNYSELLKKGREFGSTDIFRLCYEYLPISFSRRHGDPSRPWNKFSIDIKKEDGSPNFGFQGNWRDIFQNWEALTLSFPGYIESIIVKFLNASTIDGYNPYRISREGIDWEVIEPDDPWSYIGYWGDHQIIYLQKLLEVSYQHDPSKILNLLDEDSFVYANVPYKIKTYAETYSNPYDTIDFEEEKDNEIEELVAALGADGKLVQTSLGEIFKSSFTEKILLTLLTKLYNFVPDAGVWLNTQRPEWNDANNALVGNGVSLVTLGYLRRFVVFLKEVYSSSDLEVYKLNQPLRLLLMQTHAVLQDFESLISTSFDDSSRKAFVDRMGKAGESYRESVYQRKFSEIEELPKSELLKFLDLVEVYSNDTILKNKRKDNLYHAYNLIDFKPDGISITRLYEMLEGQVAVLSSGLLSAKDSLELLDSLKASDIYREEQYSYMLYPNRELPRFLEKNCVPESSVQHIGLVKKLLANGDHSLMTCDVQNGYHFNGKFNNAEDLEAALDNLSSSDDYKNLVIEGRSDLLELFESVFDHKAFTGRSGTFFGYEGLGSIYWHMVSKLLLAVQEVIRQAETTGEQESIGRLIDHYYEIRAGIGINKSPELYGAFPTDPYSHTPFGKGVQQPGMTGQVKEDIISRWAELGVSVKDAKIHFNPSFLSENEYLKSNRSFEYFDLTGKSKEIHLEKDELVFTYCQVPVIYNNSNNSNMQVELKSGNVEVIEGLNLTSELSKMIFERSGDVVKVTVSL